MELKELRKRQRDLVSLILERLDKASLQKGLPLSFLGARVCYAETHPLSLFKEEKFQDQQRLISFLLHLKSAGHFSVFAHTPIPISITDLSLSDKYHLSRTYFKAFFWEEKGLALFNLRHIAENVDETTFLKLISCDLDLSVIKIKIFKREKEGWEKSWEGNLQQATALDFSPPQEIFARPEVILLQVDDDPFFWTSIMAHGFSRIFSHQFVRHTWLNFNQRSHRYTKVDTFAVPSTFKELHLAEYRRIIKETLSLYEEWTRQMKKESARFILPQGVATTILASGPLFIWQDFIEKRAIPQAQEEIRDLAILLKEVLST